MKNINNISRFAREGNMELLRIIAMILVLMVHANFYSLGTPRHEDIELNFASSFLRILFNFISVICVTIFILISGWFSIKINLKGFSKLIFQCLFFSFGLLLVFVLIGKSEFSLKKIQTCLYLSKWDWFVKSYIALYILSPVLNNFIEHNSKKRIEYFLLSFYLFQTIFAFRGSASFILNGYSVFSFIGLYVLGRYLKLYFSKNIKIRNCLAIIFLLTILNSLIYMFDAYLDTWVVSGICLSYANPLNIATACCYILLFSQLQIKSSKFLFFLSTSSFAVYLFHFDQHILKDYYCNISKWIYLHSNGMQTILYFCIFIMVTYLVAILFDQPRKLLWRNLEKLIFRSNINRNSSNKVLE